MVLEGYLVAKLVVFIVIVGVRGNPSYVVESNLNRSSFPKGFVFGTASSAYQVSLNL